MEKGVHGVKTDMGDPLQEPSESSLVRPHPSVGRESPAPGRDPDEGLKATLQGRAQPMQRAFFRSLSDGSVLGEKPQMCPCQKGEPQDIPRAGAQRAQD